MTISIIKLKSIEVYVNPTEKKFKDCYEEEKCILEFQLHIRSFFNMNQPVSSSIFTTLYNLDSVFFCFRLLIYKPGFQIFFIFEHIESQINQNQ